jgi:hypothetical protein
MCASLKQQQGVRVTLKLVSALIIGALKCKLLNSLLQKACHDDQ